MAAAKAERWAVVCADYRRDTYRSEAAAKAGRDAIEEVGECHLAHTVERVCHHAAREFVGPGGIPGTDRTVCGLCGVALDPGIA
jgi:hypothetical protein